MPVQAGIIAPSPFQSFCDGVDKQLMDKTNVNSLPEFQKIVCLIFDDVRIKEQLVLVYDKHTSQIKLVSSILVISTISCWRWSVPRVGRCNSRCLPSLLNHSPALSPCFSINHTA